METPAATPPALGKAKHKAHTASSSGSWVLPVCESGQGSGCSSVCSWF